MTLHHVPAMLDEVLHALAPRDGEVFVDGTFGAGGYARALLGAADCRVFAIDRDPQVIARGAAMAQEFGDRLTLIEGRFSEMERLLGAHGVDHVDGVTLDIGVSSFQLGDATRGFSFQADGPLDMRMGREGESAADVVNSRSEADLATILHELGEERHARRVARAIVAAREEAPIRRTGRLAGIVERTLGRRPGKKIHPATRTFQALRILVNDELGELRRALVAAERLLTPAGRLAVVAFHSLEDAIVKAFLAERAGRLPTGSRHRPDLPGPAQRPSFRLLRTGAVKPSDAETAANPRARSARMRVAIRTAAPAWEAV